MQLLHLDSSIQGDRSASRAISGAIVDALRAADPTLETSYRDLAADPVPHLSLDVLADPSANAELQGFLAADIVVIGAGLYNFGIPSQLKAWVDRILVAGQTFRYTPEGPAGMVAGKRVIVAMAKGGIYTPGTPMAAFDHAETYLRAVFGFIGVTDLEVILAEGLALSEESRAAAVADALERAGAVRVAALVD